uniref:Nucleotid_trans domain-containing protein n=1 Tax=Caenorhabditis tropicalis TaxID=1561998 RepID=A0A1I7V1B3_9PELO
MKEVLKGCGGELMDPRTTKMKFQEPDYPDMYIHGGIHIRRNDGRLAVIDINYYDSYHEDAGTQEIQKYLSSREIWESKDDYWYEPCFRFFFF